MSVQHLDADEFASVDEEAAELGIALSQRPEVRRVSVTTAEGELSALVWGSGEPELALLHGAGLNAHTWDGVALALNRPLVAIDLPGHGHSAWRQDGLYDPTLLAGPVGEALGSKRPELVRSQVLVEAVPTLPGENPVRSFLSGPQRFASREEIVQRALEFGFGRSPEAVRRGVALNTRMDGDGSWVWRHHLGAGTAQLSADFAPLWGMLETYGGAVTLLRGERGFISEEQLLEFKRRLPNATVEQLPTGHNIQEDDPVALAQQLGALR
jgi:pimeloyl-ACP methyl ester carboxylesterase